MQKNKTKEPRLIVGVMILMVSNIIVKVIGVLFKIPLHNLLKDRGMSYFNIRTLSPTSVAVFDFDTKGLPFYYDENGKDKIWLGNPEKATRYKTIGEAMKVSARLSTENKGVYFKAIPIYNEEVLTKKNKTVNKN